PAALRGGDVRRLEVLHVVDAVLEREARLVELADTEADELLLHQPGTVVLRRDWRLLEGVVAGLAHEQDVAALLVDRRALRPVDLEAALAEAGGPVEYVHGDGAALGLADHGDLVRIGRLDQGAARLRGALRREEG